MNEIDKRHWEWLKGDKGAFDFITVLFGVLHLWDDLIDREDDPTPDAINAAMWHALVTLPENAFYQRHFYALMPVLKVAIANWHAANQMEREDDENGKRIAFILRSTYVDLVTSCAYIVGGRDWATQVAYECRKETSAEGWDHYLTALTHEQRK